MELSYENSINFLQVFTPRGIQIVDVVKGFSPIRDDQKAVDLRPQFTVTFKVKNDQRLHTVTALSSDGWVPIKELVSKLNLLAPV